MAERQPIPADPARNALTFSYTVGGSDATVSALAITAVNLLNGAKITDVAGNSANLSAALTTFSGLQIDPPTVPTVPTVPAVPTISSFSTDSGVVGDHITNDNTLTLAGTADADSTVKVYDGATLLGSATASGSGTWSYTTAALADGGHSLSATDTDAVGNTSAASTALAVTVDTVAPATPTSSYAIGTGSFAYLVGTAEANSTVSILNGANGTLVGTAVATASGSWSFMKFGVTATTFNLTATDAAGNSSGAPHSQAPVSPALATNAAAPASGNDSNTFAFSDGSGFNTTATHSLDAFQPSHDPFAIAATAIEASFANLADVTALAALHGPDVGIVEPSTLQNTVLSHLTTNSFHLV